MGIRRLRITDMASPTEASYMTYQDGVTGGTRRFPGKRFANSLERIPEECDILSGNARGITQDSVFRLQLQRCYERYRSRYKSFGGKLVVERYAHSRNQRQRGPCGRFRYNVCDQPYKRAQKENRYRISIKRALLLVLQDRFVPYL